MAVSSCRIVTLTTDFGHQDPYVGIVKGVILSGFPQAKIVDLNHEIPSFDICSGAWSLKISLPYFADGSIHIAVVDPEVGSSQRRIALQVQNSILLSPDNGLTTPFIHQAKRAFVLDKSQFFLKSVSSTFHARDIFASIAAHLLNGMQLEEVATEIDKGGLTRLENFEPVEEPQQITGAIVYIDRFGNLITNIKADCQSRISEIELDKQVLKLAQGSYGTITDGKPEVIAGSHGYLELAMNQESAQQFLKAKNGMKVTARLRTL